MSISFNLDAASIKSALLAHVQNTLGIKTEGKTLDFVFVTGRKTRNNPNPETSATITLSETGEVVQQAPTVEEEAVTEQLSADTLTEEEPELPKATEEPSVVEEDKEQSIVPTESEVDDDMFDD